MARAFVTSAIPPRPLCSRPRWRDASYVTPHGGTGKIEEDTVYSYGMASPNLLPAYAELHCLSNFSFLRGASHPEELVERAKRLGYAALALTDECTLAGVVRAHLAAKDAGLPLILGSEFTLDDATKLVLLASDRESYGDLSQLITRGRRQARKGAYRLTRDDVRGCASACLALWLPAMDLHAGDLPDALRRDAAWLQHAFPGRAWIGVELLAQAGDTARLARCDALSRASGVPLVAAGDAHMHVRARRALQDTLTAVRLKTPLAECGQALHPNGERHLRSRGRLANVYPPGLLAESVQIAARCRFSLDELRYEYPEEIVPPGETATSWLRKQVEDGLASRYPNGRHRQWGHRQWGQTPFSLRQWGQTPFSFRPAGCKPQRRKNGV